MLYSKVVLNLVIIYGWFLEGISSSHDVIPFNEKLITSLRNDVNLDLPVDEEYEDLRAELLAYHTTLATLSDTASRRSMKSSSCWNLGGICVNYKLCEGYRYLTEVPGCKDKLTVCCLAWNKFHVRDWSDFGLHNIALPWGNRLETGGKGVLDVERPISKKHKKKKKLKKVKEPPKVSSKVADPQEPGLRDLDIYNVAFPRKDSDEFGEKRVVEIEPKIFQVGKKLLMAKDISKNNFQKESALRSIRSSLPFLMISLEAE